MDIKKFHEIISKMRHDYRRWVIKRFKVVKNFDFNNVDLSNMDLSQKIFINCTFDGVKFANTNLDNTTFTDCSLQFVNFTHTKINNATFNHCSFEKSLINSSIKDSTISWGDFSCSEFVNGTLENVSMDNCTFYFTSFSNVDIINCSFTTAFSDGVMLNNVTAESTDLSELNF